MLIAIIIVLVYEWKCDEGMITDAYKHNASTCISKLLATTLTCSHDPMIHDFVNNDPLRVKVLKVLQTI